MMNMNVAVKNELFLVTENIFHCKHIKVCSKIVQYASINIRDGHMSHNTKTLHKHFQNCQKEIERSNLENDKHQVQTTDVDLGKYLWCLADSF